MKRSPLVRVIALVVGVGLLLACGIFAAGFISGVVEGSPSDNDGRRDPTAAAADRATAEAFLGGRAAPPTDRLRDELDAALGASNREGSKLTAVEQIGDNIAVTWKLDDHFSSGLILAQAQADAARILEAVAASSAPYRAVTLAGTFAMQDAAGNPLEAVVVQATYDRTTLEGIDWADFNAARVFEEPAARGIFIHPTLAE